MTSAKLTISVVATLIALGGIGTYVFLKPAAQDAKAIAKELHDLQRTDEEERLARAKADDERKRQESANTKITNPWR